MPQQFDNQDAPQTPPALRSQRMTADEAKAVIDLWQRERDEQFGLTDRPAVPDVAEGLNIGVEDVQRLLGEVRERRAEEEHALAYEQELAEIRRAEAERKLAEVRRQRAEVWREQTEAERRRENNQPPPSHPALRADRQSPAFRMTASAEVSRKRLTVIWPLSVLVVSVLVVIWLISVIYHQRVSPQSPPSGGYHLTTPNGTPLPCS